MFWGPLPNWCALAAITISYEWYLMYEWHLVVYIGHRTGEETVT